MERASTCTIVPGRVLIARASPAELHKMERTSTCTIVPSCVLTASAIISGAAPK